MKCKSCNVENPEGAAFCSNCGSSLGADIKVKIQRGIVQPQRRTPQIQHRQVTSRRSVSMPGMCFYHQQLPATYVCSRCGRAICHSCSSFIGPLAFCPHCRR